MFVLQRRRLAVLQVLRGPGLHAARLAGAALQVEDAGAGRHAGVGVDAAVRGRALDVREAQHLGVHQVVGAKVLLVAVAGGVAGERVAAGVAGGLLPALVVGGQGQGMDVMLCRYACVDILSIKCCLIVD